MKRLVRRVSHKDLSIAKRRVYSRPGAIGFQAEATVDKYKHIQSIRVDQMVGFFGKLSHHSDPLLG